MSCFIGAERPPAPAYRIAARTTLRLTMSAGIRAEPMARTPAQRRKAKRNRDARGLRSYRLDLQENELAILLLDRGLFSHERDALDHKIIEQAASEFFQKIILILCNDVTSEKPSEGVSLQRMLAKDGE
jgi:hypothetical protein